MNFSGTYKQSFATAAAFHAVLDTVDVVIDETYFKGPSPSCVAFQLPVPHLSFMVLSYPSTGHNHLAGWLYF